MPIKEVDERFTSKLASQAMIDMGYEEETTTNKR
jgi:RNase H-fold protein (predicted Holliday junction resolvase)